MILTENEKTLLKEFLAVELEKGGNKYTNVLLKIEKELKKETEWTK